MAGLSALQSKLSKLNKTSQPLRKKKVSVVYIKEDGSIDFPENCNKGVLCVPRPMTEEQWELQNDK